MPLSYGGQMREGMQAGLIGVDRGAILKDSVYRDNDPFILPDHTLSRDRRMIAVVRVVKGR